MPFVAWRVEFTTEKLCAKCSYFDDYGISRFQYVKEPSREDLLPPPLPAPYIQPKYTLVIELKNVLLAPEWSYSTGWRFKKRPAIEYFLDTVGYPNFEVVIYTSEPSMTAAPLVDSFDPKQRIMYRCYRDCTKYMKGHHVKDLEKLRRDMSKVIMMDHDPQSFQLNPENALRIPSWNGDMNDTALVDLAELLKTIYLSDVDDVRPTLQYYSQFDDPAKEFRRRATFLAQQ
uniref:Mitochondrial import inner membrane translocase subunit TIM50 n=1 Tax=Plectus sambesii TaxID=2011161 RepID=A0A914UWY4_9BILA